MASQKQPGRPPSLPEYPDTGCGGLCTSSLNCPYPVCRLDDPTVVDRGAQEARYAEIRRLRGLGHLWREIAAMTGVSMRTVARALGQRR